MPWSARPRPVTAYLLGLAAARQGASPPWSRAWPRGRRCSPRAGSGPPAPRTRTTVTDEVPDDSGVDHTGERFEALAVRLRRLRRMRAVIANGTGGPEVLSVAEVPDVQAGPGEVLIAVVAAGLNRADLLQRQGFYPPPPGAVRRDRHGVQRHRSPPSARASTSGRSATRCARCSRGAGTPRWSPYPPAR